MSEPVSDIDTEHGDELLAELADDFLGRHRAGERPSVDEYAEKHPELADRIRDLFPAVIVMEQSDGETTFDFTLPTERVGAIIGRYKLLERIGEGGFGVVFMAEQQHPVRRKVALKVIKPGSDTRQVIARFEAERQAIALMEHENIAKVLDAGATESGRPYFVMELVHGVPITDFCDKNQLPPRARLELFVQVCRAVQHAHTKGIIHRDIKPTNVLVTLHEGVPVPKVIDFGVAKATGQQLTDKTLFTHFAQMVGTPLYMSPEQAEMTGIDVDTRSDVYSLGVLLYELLTGTTPLDKERLKQAAFDEVRRIIREDEPPRPSARLSTMGQQAQRTISAHRNSDPKQLGRLVRGELDWIVMKALEKERARRYETASAFAADVQRYLRDEPVEACPPSVAYRLQKFIRRNKAGALAGAAIVAALVLGLGLATVGFIQARRQAEIARIQAVEATKMTQRALQVQQFLQEMLGSIDPNTKKGAAVTVQQVLDRAVGRIETAFANQPEIRAVLHETIGRTYYGLLLWEPATKHLQLAVDLRRHYLPEEPLALADAMLSLAQVYSWYPNQREKALSQCRDALALYAALIPESDARVVVARTLEAQLSNQAATAGQIDSDVWAARTLPVVLALADDQLARIPDEWALAIAEAKRLHHAGDDAGARMALKQGHNAAIAKISDLCSTGQMDAARRYIRQAYAPWLEMTLVRSFVPIVLISETWQLKNEGVNLVVNEAILREAVFAGREVWGSEHPYIAWALFDLATVLQEQGKLSEAESVAREALMMRRKLLGNENPDTVKSLNGLIDVLKQEGKSSEADNLRREMAVPAAAASPPSTNPKPPAP